MGQWLADNILLVLVVLVAGGGALAWLAERRRRQKLVAGYTALGFERLPEGHLAPLMGPDRFWLLNWSRWRRVGELARGHWHDHEVLQFRLTLPDALGRGQHQTATLIRDAGALPEFHLRPETLRDRMGAVMGDGGIDFPALSRYTGEYCTDGDGGERADEVVPDALLAWLKHDSGWCLEARGGHLLVFRVHALVRREADIPEHLDLALEVLQQLR